MITISSPTSNSTIASTCAAHGTKTVMDSASGVMRPSSGNPVNGSPVLAIHPNWALQFAGLTPGKTYTLEVTAGSSTAEATNLLVQSGP